MGLRSFATARIQWYSNPLNSLKVIALYWIGPEVSALADPVKKSKSNYLIIAGVISQLYHSEGQWDSQAKTR